MIEVILYSPQFRATKTEVRTVWREELYSPIIM